MTTVGDATSLVARVALIMNLFDAPGRRLRLDQVVLRTGLPRSSTHRILTQLQSAGLLQHRPDGYAVAASPLPATRMVGHAELRGAASPILGRLHTDTRLVVQLGVLLGADVVCLDKIASDSAALIPPRVGGRSPAHASALGKTMLARLPAEQVDAVVGVRPRRQTRATITDLTTLHQELARIRSRHGVAYDREELALGAGSVAAPIHTGDDTVIAGLSLTGAVSAHRLQRTAPFLMRAAARVSRQLGRIGPDAETETANATDSDSMLSRVLRTVSSEVWL